MMKVRKEGRKRRRQTDRQGGRKQESKGARKEGRKKERRGGREGEIHKNYKSVIMTSNRYPFFEYWNSCDFS